MSQDEAAPISTGAPPSVFPGAPGKLGGLGDTANCAKAPPTLKRTYGCDYAITVTVEGHN